MNNNANNSRRQQSDQLPVAKNEDVEFTAELADADDLEAAERAQAADYRQEQS